MASWIRKRENGKAHAYAFPFSATEATVVDSLCGLLSARWAEVKILGLVQNKCAHCAAKVVRDRRSGDLSD